MITGLAGYFAVAFQNAIIAALVWLAAGVLVGAGGVWVPLKLVPDWLPRLEPVLRNWVTFSWQENFGILLSSAAISAGLAFLIIGRIWFEGFGAAATFLGLLSAGIAIALKDPLVNLMCWGYILSRRPFGVGDRIQIGAAAGDVIDRGLFHFSLMEVGNWVDADQSSGRIVHVPNGTVLSQPVANYDKGFRYIWSEIPVTITFESNWKKAKGILETIARRHAEQLTEQVEKELLEASRRYLIAYTKLTPIVYVRVADHGIRLTLRYLIRSRFRRGSENAIWQDVLEAFAAEPDIDFAYPTTRQVVREKH